MMDRTEQETGWFHDLAEWISYNPRTVALGIYLAGCMALAWLVGAITTALIL